MDILAFRRTSIHIHAVIHTRQAYIHTHTYILVHTYIHTY